MKELLLSSTLPYWVVFAIITTAGVLGLLKMHKHEVSKQTVLTVTALAITGTILELVIYDVAKGSSLWWCTSSEYGFFSKLLRSIPLFIFVAIQVAQVFVYRLLVEQYYQKELSISGSFISLIVIIPAAIVLYIMLDLFGMGETTRNIVFYTIITVGLAIGVGWAMTKNVKAIGMKPGVIFTATTIVMIIGGLVSLMILLIAILELILQILSVVAVAGFGFYMLRNVFSPAMDIQSRTDISGKVHKTARDKENADFQLRKIRNDKNSKPS